MSEIKFVKTSGSKKIYFTTVVITLLVIFLILFPKGGVKLGGLPLTFGYMLFAVVTMSMLFINIYFGRLFIVSRPQLAVLVAMCAFQLVVSLTLIANGYEDVGYLVALLISLFFLPIALMYFLMPQIQKLDLDLLLKLIKNSVLAVSIYGIFLFLYIITTGNYFEIPLLTVNSGDLGQMGEKFNNRGQLVKLFSTYNNGNIYGVSLLILLPLFCLIENSFLKKLMVKLSLVLTLSRTVWIGLILYEILSFRSIAKGREIYRLIGIIILGTIIYSSVAFMERDMDFLLDSSLGGRIDHLEFSPTIISKQTFISIGEIVPATVLQQFGLVGLLTFLIYMTMPVFVWLVGLVPYHKSEYKRSLAMGLLIYCIIMFSDGAMNYIPVMMYYWFVVALLLTKNIPLKTISRLTLP